MNGNHNGIESGQYRQSIGKVSAKYRQSAKLGEFYRKTLSANQDQQSSVESKPK
jgi:hypothetical protein